MRIAQPALSRQIRLLEQELGTRLFDRHGRGMIATEKGHDVLRHAQRIMAEMEEIRVLAQDENAPLRGHVSIGMPPTASDILSEPLVSTFQETHPDATLRIVNAYSGYLVDWLHRGDIDAAILYNPKNARSFHIQPLLEEALSSLVLQISIRYEAVRLLSANWKRNVCFYPVSGTACGHCLKNTHKKRVSPST